MGNSTYFRDIKVGNVLDISDRTGVTELRIFTKGLISSLNCDGFDHVQLYIKDKVGRDIPTAGTPDYDLCDVTDWGDGDVIYSTSGLEFFAELRVVLNAPIGDGDDGLTYIRGEQNFNYNGYQIIDIAYVK